MPITENKTAPFIQTGKVAFNNEKTKNVVFEKLFAIVPAVDLTLNQDTSSPPFRVDVIKNGFTIKFKTNYTGDVEWKATDPRKL